MPTGYTAAIADGITFQQYAMNCARAFGALITMRDEPSGAPIPDVFEPSDYHSTKVLEARAMLAQLEAMSEAHAKRAADKAWDDAETHRIGRLLELASLREKYTAMLSQAKAYVAPTPDHEQFRTFMCEQIEQSIDFDCDTKYHDAPTTRLSALEWLGQQRAQAIHDIEYHSKSDAEEIDRAAKRTAWVANMRQSLAEK